MPVKVAAPLAVLVSITIAVVVLIQDWRNVHLASAGRLLFFTLFGIPFGLLLLAAVPEPVVNAVLALVIILFSTFSLTRSRPFELKNDRPAWVAGFVAGVLGGAYGMNGPPLAIYGTLRGWRPQHFRATLQAYFLPASLVGMCGYGRMDLWTPVVNRYYVMALPAALVATFLGRMANKKMDEGSFLRYVHIGLILIGTLLLVEAGASSQRQPPIPTPHMLNSRPYAKGNSWRWQPSRNVARRSNSELGPPKSTIPFTR